MTVTQTPPANRPPPKRWTAAEFDRLVAMGAFDGERVELIDGELLEVPPMNEAHAQAVQLAQYALLAIFPAGTHTIGVQLPMRLPTGSRPSPDLVVVLGTPRQVVQHPSTALLVVEVADSTLAFDRIEKGELYARNLLADYWIVNLQGRCIEIHRRPVRDQSGAWRFDDVRSVDESGTISPLAASGRLIKVVDVLP